MTNINAVPEDLLRSIKSREYRDEVKVLDALIATATESCVSVKEDHRYHQGVVGALKLVKEIFVLGKSQV